MRVSLVYDDVTDGQTTSFACHALLLVLQISFPCLALLDSRLLTDDGPAQTEREMRIVDPRSHFSPYKLDATLFGHMPFLLL